MGDKSCLYVVELEPGKDPEAKWYVGVSKEPDRRRKQHSTNGGAKWTRRNRMVDFHKISWHPERFIRKMERHLTAVLMEAYGRDSTRGASYLSPTLIHAPSVETDAMPEEMVKGLRESGSEELARVATKPRFHITIEKSFRNCEEAADWAEENLPEGISMKLSKPIDPRNVSFTLGGSDSD